MAKHIVVPATAEQIARTLGVTQEDRDIVAKVLRELDYDQALLDTEDPDPCDSASPKGSQAPKEAQVSPEGGRPIAQGVSPGERR